MCSGGTQPTLPSSRCVVTRDGMRDLGIEQVPELWGCFLPYLNMREEQRQGHGQVFSLYGLSQRELHQAGSVTAPGAVGSISCMKRCCGHRQQVAADQLGRGISVAVNELCQCNPTLCKIDEGRCTSCNKGQGTRGKMNSCDKRFRTLNRGCLWRWAPC